MKYKEECAFTKQVFGKLFKDLEHHNVTLKELDVYCPYWVESALKMGLYELQHELSVPFIKIHACAQYADYIVFNIIGNVGLRVDYHIPSVFKDIDALREDKDVELKYSTHPRLGMEFKLKKDTLGANKGDVFRIVANDGSEHPRIGERYTILAPLNNAHGNSVWFDTPLSYNTEWFEPCYTEEHKELIRDFNRAKKALDDFNYKYMEHE